MRKNKKTKSIKTLLMLSTILATFNTQNVQAIDENVEEENQESIDIELVKEDSSTIENDNLVRNGDFSKLLSDSRSPWTRNTPEDWGLWIPADIEAKDYVSEINDNGQLVLSSLEETFRAAVNQDLEIDSTKTYQLSFDIQTLNKEGLARIRIMEKNDDEQLNLWYSNNFHGDTDLQTVKTIFEPRKDTNNITIELFFESGTGTVIFDNLRFSEIILDEESNEEELEDSIDIYDNSIYTTVKEEYDYKIEDPSIAENRDGIIFPTSTGETAVKVYDEDNELIAEMPLKIQSHENTTYNEMLEEWNRIIAGNELFDENNSEMVKGNEKIEQEVDNILNKYLDNIHTDDYLWDDVTDYNDSANLTTSYRRVETVAKQITQPASRYYNDPTAIRMVKNSLNWLYKNAYNEDSYIVGNWWDYEIGAPRALNNTLSLMYQYFSKDEKIMYTNAINKFVPDPYQFRVTTGNPFDALGGNLIDMGRVKIISGAIREDDDIIEESIEALSQAFAYTEPGKAGFYPDGSYIDHDNVALTGAYGNVMIDGLSQLLPVVLPAEILTDDELDILYDFLDDSFLPLIHKGEMMDMTRGRAISRQELQSHAAGGEILRGILRIADVSEKEKEHELKSIVKKIVSQNTFYNIYDSLSSYKDIYLMDQLLQNDEIVASNDFGYLSIFNDMDKVVYRNNQLDFAFGISMYSDKTQNYEYMNEENAKGWYTADGAIYHYNDDLSHYNDNYWATVDPYYIPGTTTLSESREPGSGMVTLPNEFVGGTKLDENTATIAMDFVNWNEQLSVKKSWFILDDKIVFLGTDINNQSGHSAFTTIENRKVTNSKYNFLVNNEKIDLKKNESISKNLTSLFLESTKTHKNNIGYLFFEDTTLDILNEEREGSWNDINNAQSDTYYKNEYIKISQDHLNNDDTYSYIMYPNITAKDFQDKATENSVSIIENNKKVQAIYDESLNQWNIVLYEDQAFEVDDYFTINKRGLYAIKIEDEHYIVSHYDPVSEEYSEDTIESPNGHQVMKKSSLKDKSTIIKVNIESDKDEESDKDDGPDKDEESGKVDESDKDAESDKDEESDKNDESEDDLPKTGETSSILFYVLGFMLLGGGIILYNKSQKNK